jgi:hypothetical protein
LQAEGGGVDEVPPANSLRELYAVAQRGIDVGRGEWADFARDGNGTEIGVGSDFVGGNAGDGRMSGNVDGVGDDGGGGVGLSGGFGKNADGVSDPE